MVVCYVCDKPYFDETLMPDGSKVLRSDWKPWKISYVKVMALMLILGGLLLGLVLYVS